METVERRRAIMRILGCRGSEIVENIAAEFGVSERTIRRDIEVLSRTEPIYTKSGRYGGGVYVMDGYRANEFYFDCDQSAVLNKLLCSAENKTKCELTCEEIVLFRQLILKHTIKAT